MDALHGRWLSRWRKSLTATIQECCKQYWTSPGGNNPQSGSYMATNHSSLKLSKLDEPDMQDTAGEVGTRSEVLYSSGPLHMAEQRQGDQLEPTHCSSVQIRGVALKTSRKRWTIGRGDKRGPEISVLMAWRNDNMLKWIVWNRTFWWFNWVYTNVWCLIELVVNLKSFNFVDLCLHIIHI